MGYPGYFSEYNSNEMSKDKYDELVKNGHRDPEVAAGLKTGPEKWEDVLHEIEFALDWKINCDFAAGKREADFYRRWGYKNPTAKLESNKMISYTYRMSDEYRESLEDKTTKAFGGLSSEVLSDEPELDTKEPTKYDSKKARVHYLDTKYIAMIGERAERGAKLLGEFYFCLWD
jgi:hypothetical protein